ncbi:LrgB family protein [Anaerobacillus sp. CMMVII]|uniref:LrgB family protein n=1 Tax=Anaerobacillus sp. CMMVII TaxID=2755588 RepID=UPI0021B839DF|nr:LrgB family protein [Anaerobacillus sp. CMMVII]MCT8137282.1 LrgB family protein [Anaerobacillus sp. CMMVII]
MKLGITLTAIVVTLVIYYISKRFYLRFPTPLTIPLVIGTLLIIVLLTVSGIPYETYMVGGKWIEQLLGPAVVALAFPLYKHRQVLKTYMFPLCLGVSTGALLGVLTGVQLSRLFGIEDVLIYSILPKSVTTPVAMEVAATLGGIPALAAIFVMIAGIGGVIIGPFLLKLFQIDHVIGKGIGLGSAAHAIGTSKALEFGELEGAISSVSMTLTAIFVSCLTPAMIYLFL